MRQPPVGNGDAGVAALEWARRKLAGAGYELDLATG
jgi:hypothetical protein